MELLVSIAGHEFLAISSEQSFLFYKEKSFVWTNDFIKVRQARFYVHPDRQ